MTRPSNIPPTDVVLRLDEVRSLVDGIFARAGVPEDERTVLVHTLLDEQLRGISGHGLARVKSYLSRIVSGTIRLPTRLEKTVDRGAVSGFDGHNGLGQWIAHQAMSEAIRKASLHGVGIAVVRNSQHFGAAGYYAAIAGEHDMAGIAISNSSPRIAPWGGVEALFGTNPWSIAMPTADADRPFVLDISNAIGSAGRIREAAAAGTPIPAGWALNSQGLSTDDPFDALAGSLLPIGGHKGSGITFALGALCSLLSGGLFDAETRPVDDLSAPQGLSHLFIAIDIQALQPVATFKDRMEELLQRVRTSGSLTEAEPRVPGERGYNSKAKIIASGYVSVPTDLWQDLHYLR